MNSIINKLIDRINIETPLGKTLVSQLIAKVIFKGTGSSSTVYVDKARLCHEEDGDTTVELNISLRMSDEDTRKLLSNLMS